MESIRRGLTHSSSPRRCHVQTRAPRCFKGIYMRRTSLSCSKPRNGIQGKRRIFCCSPVVLARRTRVRVSFVRDSTRRDKENSRGVRADPIAPQSRMSSPHREKNCAFNRRKISAKINSRQIINLSLEKSMIRN